MGDNNSYRSIFLICKAGPMPPIGLSLRSTWNEKGKYPYLQYLLSAKFLLQPRSQGHELVLTILFLLFCSKRFVHSSRTAPFVSQAASFASRTLTFLAYIEAAITHVSNVVDLKIITKKFDLRTITLIVKSRVPEAFCFSNVSFEK